jgi:signal transduction histidine kinase
LRGTKTDVSTRKHLEAQLQRSEREARLLYQAALAISAELDLDAQLHRVLEAALQLANADEAQVALVDESDANIEIVAAWGEAGMTVGLRQPCGTGLLGEVCATNRSVRSEDLLCDSRTYELEQMRQIGVRAWLGTPLADRGGQVIGALIALRTEPSPFSDEDERRLHALASLAAAVVRQDRLRGEVRRLAAMEERTRLARELHDSVTQSLFSASMLAQAAQSLWQREPERAKERLDRAAELCGGALAEMRALIFELRPDALAEEGLVSALSKHAAAREARDGVAVKIRTHAERRLPARFEEAAYRIVREALHNVMKHARASNVTVDVNFEPGQLRLDVRDDGRGFEPSQRSTGLGLTSMRERAEQLGGTLTVVSSSGSGTRVHAEIPLPHEP